MADVELQRRLQRVVVPPPGASSSAESTPAAAPAAAAPPPPPPQRPGQDAATLAKPVSMLRILSLCDPVDALLLLLSCVGAAAAGAALPLFTLVFGSVLDTLGAAATPGSIRDAISSLALDFLYLALGAGAAAWVEVAAGAAGGARLARRLRLAYLRAALRQDQAFYDVGGTAAALLQGLNEDADDVQSAVGDKLPSFVHHIATFAAGMGIAFAKGPAMAGVVLATLPLVALSGAGVATAIARSQAAVNRASAAAVTIAGEALAGVRAVAGAGAAGGVVARYDDANATPERVGARTAWMQGATLGLANASFLWTYAIALYFGWTRIRDGAYTGGQAMTVLFAAQMGGINLGVAIPTLEAFAKAGAAGGRLLAVVRRVPAIGGPAALARAAPPPRWAWLARLRGVTAPSVQEARPASASRRRPTGWTPPRSATPRAGGREGGGGASPPSSSSTPHRRRLSLWSPQAKKAAPLVIKGHLTLSGVTFQYPTRAGSGAPPALAAVSLDAPAGATTALVGASGSGKSTVVQLLLRLYDPDAGAVLVDGRDLRSLDVAAFRAATALVPQEPTLFSASIADNIAFARPGATPADVEAAARAAGAHAFISALPAGYATLFGHQGGQLSGGQRARIALARAFVREPKILLLDEATAALDATSERAVQAGLDALRAGRTTVVVAHRLSTVVDADRIYVLGGGRVVEGPAPHAALLAADGPYAALVRLQVAATEKAGTGVSRQVEAGPSSSSSAAGEGGVDAAAAAATAAAPSAAAAPVDPPPPRVPYRRLIALLKPREYPLILTGAAGSAVLGARMPVFAVVLSGMLGVFYRPPDAALPLVRRYCLVFFGVGCAVIVGAVAQHASLGAAGARVTRRLRAAALGAALAQEMAWHDAPANGAGALAPRLALDAGRVRGVVGDAVAVAVESGVGLAAGLAVAYVAGWRLALVITACLPLLGGAAWVQGAFISGFTSRAGDATAAANVVAAEALAAPRVVAAYGLATPLGAAYDALLRGPARRAAARGVATGAAFGASQFCLFAAYALAFWYGGQLVAEGRMTLESVLKVFFAVMLSAMGLQNIQVAFPDIGHGAGAARRTFALLDRVPSVRAGVGGLAPSSVAGAIQFKAVSFAYPARPAAPVLTGLSLSIGAGQTVAIVGESGGGKSTLLALAVRFYDVAAGAVTLDGVDVRDLDLAWLRGVAGYVCQEAVIFSGTVLDNLTLGAGDAAARDPARVRAALVAAHAAEFVDALPAGLSTRLGRGDGALSLSGGQAARLALARVLLREPKILLLDEATAALDAASEAVVQRALDAAAEGRTTLVVAHRLATVAAAHKIAVVGKGRVIEEGAPAALAAAGGAYAALLAASARGRGK